MKNEKYPGLNGLRALSIFSVILYHLNIQDNIFRNLQGTNWARYLTDFLADGQMGVNVFFVISGFLITTLLQKEENDNRTISVKNFYIRRTLRIFPAYYFLLLVYFVLQLLAYLQISKESWLTAVTYTKYFNWALDWYTRHAWSLSIEEHFYIFWPLIFIAGNKFRKYASIFLILMVPLIRVYTHFYPVSWMNELTIFKRIDSIAMGCFFALYKDSILKKMSRYWKPTFYFSVITLFFLKYLFILSQKVHLAYVFIPLGVTHGTIANLLIALIMMYSVFGPRGFWFSILNFKMINYIGLLSYSLYLWQQLFIYKTKYWVTLFPQNIFFIVLAAMCSYYLVEKPFLKLKTRFSIGYKRQ